MTINFTTTMLDPIYSAFGVDIEFALVSEDLVTLRAIDKTAGAEVIEATSGIALATVRPAAVIRMAELSEASLAPADLVDALFQMSGLDWRVRSYHPKPSPNGIGDGELYLIISKVI